MHLREREEVEGRGAEMAPPADGVGRWGDRLRTVPETFLLDLRAAPPSLLGAGRTDRDRGPPMDRAPFVRAGQLLELDDAPDFTADELATEPGKVERLRHAFLASRFAGVVPLFAERAFLLRMEGFAVSRADRRRVRRRRRRPVGGRRLEDRAATRSGDPLAGLQLDLYGLACVEVWGKRPEDLTLTYLYLAGGEEVSHPMSDPDEVRTRVTASLRSIGEGAFDPTPGAWCHHCDFLSFCDAGRAWVARDA